MREILLKSILQIEKKKVVKTQTHLTQRRAANFRQLFHLYLRHYTCTFRHLMTFPHFWRGECRSETLSACGSKEDGHHLQRMRENREILSLSNWMLFIISSSIFLTITVLSLCVRIQKSNSINKFECETNKQKTDSRKTFLLKKKIISNKTFAFQLIFQTLHATV